MGRRFTLMKCRSEISNLKFLSVCLCVNRWLIPFSLFLCASVSSVLAFERNMGVNEPPAGFSVVAMSKHA